MKTYLEFINEEFQQNIIGIPELAKIASKSGNDKSILLKMLISTFKKGGDQNVIDMFKEMTDLNLETIRKGKYYIK